MTRKARRKRLRTQLTMMVASTALTGAVAQPAQARELEGMLAASKRREPFLTAVTRYIEYPQNASQELAGRRYDIPGGPLSTIIPLFERTSGVHLTLPSDAVLLITSPGIKGVLTVEQALEAMLSGTDLKFRILDATSALLEFRAASEAVSVTASRPGSTVASPKYTEPLRDVPQTITVIPRAVMEEQGTATLRDVLRNVTGITFQAGEGGTPAGDQMTIRGFSARTDMFIDGVRDFGGYTRDTFNLEQVEVAKGPTSAIAGRGSTGGSVNLISKQPGLMASRSVTVEGGNADHKRVTADFNQPISGLKGASLRVNVMGMDTGVPGRDVTENRGWGLAPTLAFGISSPTRVSVGYLHLHQNNIPDYGQPWVPATNIPLTAYRNNRAPIDSSNYYGLVGRDFEHVNNDLGTAQIEHDLNKSFVVRNLTRFGQTDRNSVITSPRFASDTSTDIRRTDVKWRDQSDNVLANQTNLTGHFATAHVDHDVVAGVEFARESSKNYAGAETGPQNPISPNTDLFNPDPNQVYTGRIGRTGAFTDATADSAGAYLFDTAKIGDRFELTGGMLFDRFDVDYDTVTATGVHAPLSRQDNNVSWRGGAVYKPAPAGSVYVGYATSFNPSAEGLALTTSTVNLEPEKTRNLEVGTKWDAMGGRLSLTAAGFRTVKTNARTPGINPGDPPTVLSGEQRVSGVEFGASGSINRRWMVIGGYAFMHSDIAQSNTPAEIDSALAFTPEHTLNLWTTYEVLNGVKVGGGAQFMDSVFRNAINTIVVPSYWLTNAVASYDVNTHLTLRLNANNLGGANYVDRVSGGHYVPGPGRSVVVSTNMKF